MTDERDAAGRARVRMRPSLVVIVSAAVMAACLVARACLYGKLGRDVPAATDPLPAGVTDEWELSAVSFESGLAQGIGTTDSPVMATIAMLFPNERILPDGIVRDAYGDEASVPLPLVVPRPGYHFVGWSDGGLHEPIASPFDARIDITDDSDGHKGSATLEAVYMDDEGNGYCSCGGHGDGFFKERYSEYRETADAYERLIRVCGTSTMLGMAAGAVLALSSMYAIGGGKRR